MGNVAAPEPKSSASQMIKPVLRLTMTDGIYATADLNVRSEAGAERVCSMQGRAGGLVRIFGLRRERIA